MRGFAPCLLLSPSHSLLFSLFLAAVGLFSQVQSADIDQEVNEGIADTGLNTSTWVAGKAPPISDMITVNDFQIAAKNTLSPYYYAYYRTAALDETSK